LSIPNPVLIDPLSHEVCFVPPAVRPEERLREPMALPCTLSRLPYADYPLIVTDRVGIELIPE
jgi:hypothetical protein